MALVRHIYIVEDGKVAKEGGMVYTFQVADETASVMATLWNEVGQSTQVGDIILMVGGYNDDTAVRGPRDELC